MSVPAVESSPGGATINCTSTSNLDLDSDTTPLAIHTKTVMHNNEPTEKDVDTRFPTHNLQPVNQTSEEEVIIRDIKKVGNNIINLVVFVLLCVKNLIRFLIRSWNSLTKPSVITKYLLPIMLLILIIFWLMGLLEFANLFVYSLLSIMISYISPNNHEREINQPLYHQRDDEPDVTNSNVYLPTIEPDQELLERFVEDSKNLQNETINFQPVAKDELNYEIIDKFLCNLDLEDIPIQERGAQVLTISGKGADKCLRPTTVGIYDNRPFISLFLQGLGGKPISFVFDMGAQTTSINVDVLNEIESAMGPLPRVKVTGLQLVGHGDVVIPTLGCVLVQCKLSPMQQGNDVVPMFITKSNSHCIMGINYIKAKNINVNAGKRDVTLYLDMNVPLSSHNVQVESLGVVADRNITVNPYENIVIRAPLKNVNNFMKKSLNENLLLFSDHEHTAKVELNNDNSVTLMLSNLDDEVKQYPEGSSLGQISVLAHNEVVLEEASDDVRALQTHSLIKQVHASQCFCRSKDSIRIFFVDKDGSSHFRNVDAISIYNNGPVKPYHWKENYLFLRTWYDESLVTSDIVKDLFEDDISRNIEKRPLLFVLPSDTYFSKNMLLIISEFSKYNKQIEIRFHKYTNPKALCMRHKDINLGIFPPNIETIALNIVLMNGGDLVFRPPKLVETTEVIETKVDIYTKFDRDKGIFYIDCLCHTPEVYLKNKKYINIFIKQLAKEIRKSIPKLNNTPLIKLFTTRLLSFSITDSFADILKNRLKCEGYDTNNCELDPTLHYGSVFEPKKNCPCANCNLVGLSKTDELEFLGLPIPVRSDLGFVPKKLTVATLDLDFYGEENFDDIDNVSVLSRIEEKSDDIIVEQTLSDKDEEDISENFLEQFDLSRFKGEDRSRMERMLQCFRHIFKLHGDDYLLIRDLRISVPLEIRKDKIGSSFHKTYNCDDNTSLVIKQLLRKFVKLGWGTFGGPGPYVSPLFLRVRNSVEAEKIIRDPNAKVSSRLISNFSYLNKVVVPIESYLPSTRQIIHSISHTNFLSSYDVSKAFRGLPLNPEHADSCVISCKGTYVWLLVALEGVANCPSIMQFLMDQSLFFSSCDPEKRAEDLDRYSKAHRDGKRYKIENMDDLEHHMQSTVDNFDSPERLDAPYMPYEEAPEVVKNSLGHKLRVRFSRRNKNPAIVRREEINPHMLSDERSASPYIDDIIGYSRDNESFFRDTLSLFIDIHNTGLKLSVQKSSIGAVMHGIGSIDHLGMTIYGDGSYHGSEKRSAKLETLMQPRNFKELQQCMGLFVYHSPFYPFWASDSYALYKAMPRAAKDGKKFKLTDEERDCFEKIKRNMLCKQKLYLPRKGDILYIHTDSSGYCAAAVIYAIDEQTHERRYVAFFSKLYPAYIRDKYSAVALECLALSMALYHFKYLIWSHHCVVVMDCQSILALLCYGKQTNNTRLSRLLSTITQYPLLAFHHVSSDHNLADPISRLVQFNGKQLGFNATIPFKDLKKSDVVSDFEEGKTYNLAELNKMANNNAKNVIPTLLEIEEVGTNINNDIGPLFEKSHQNFSDNLSLKLYGQTMEATQDIPVTLDEKLGPDDFLPPNQFFHVQNNSIEFQPKLPNLLPLANQDFLKYVTVGYIYGHQRKDPNIMQLINKISKNKENMRYSLLPNGLLVKLSNDDDSKYKIVLNKTLLVNIATLSHLHGHFASKKLARFIGHYFHASHVRDICDMITKSCYYCAQNVVSRNPDVTKLEIVQRANVPMKLLYMDLLIFSKPYSKTSKRYIGVLHIIDSYSSFLFSDLVTDQSSETVIRSLRKIHEHFNLRGATIRCDNAKNFKSEKIHTFADSIGLSITHVLPYSSTSNALCEVANRVWRDIFRIYLRYFQNSNIEQIHSMSTLSYNLNCHSTFSQHDDFITPFEVLHGQKYNAFTHLFPAALEPMDKEKFKSELRDFFDQKWAQHLSEKKAKKDDYTLQPGDLVVLKSVVRPLKDQPYYDGKIYKIISRFNAQVKIENVTGGSNEASMLVHSKYLKKFYFKHIEIFKYLDTTLHTILTDNLQLKDDPMSSNHSNSAEFSTQPSIYSSIDATISSDTYQSSRTAGRSEIEVNLFPVTRKEPVDAEGPLTISPADDTPVFTPDPAPIPVFPKEPLNKTIRPISPITAKRHGLNLSLPPPSTIPLTKPLKMFNPISTTVPNKTKSIEPSIGKESEPISKLPDPPTIFKPISSKVADSTKAPKPKVEPEDSLLGKSLNQSQPPTAPKSAIAQQKSTISTLRSKIDKTISKFTSRNPQKYPKSIHTTPQDSNQTSTVPTDRTLRPRPRIDYKLFNKTGQKKNK